MAGSCLLSLFGDRLFGTAARILRRNLIKVIMRRSMSKRYGRQRISNKFLPSISLKQVSFVQWRAEFLAMNPHFLNKRLSHTLGYAGLIPFFMLMLGVWFADSSWLNDFVRGQLAYG